MEGYWRSDSLMFIGKTDVTYGYNNTLVNYRKRYPDRTTMGTLHFDVLSLETLSEDAYFMVGRWSLQRSIGDVSGHFSLLFRRVGRQWRIVKDHSS